MPPPYKGFNFEYPGPPEIARLAISHLAPEGEWMSSPGACVELYEHKRLPDGNLSPHYGEWALRLRSNDPQDRSRCATIEVLELRGELLPWGEPKTVLIFLDARDATQTREKPEPIGGILEDLCQAVHMEVHRTVGQRPAQAEAQVTTPEEGSGSKPPVGRPSIAEDDWAYQEIEAGRDQTEVYKEWRERIPDIRRSQLADPLDSFKKAIRNRKKRGKKEKRE